MPGWQARWCFGPAVWSFLLRSTPLDTAARFSPPRTSSLRSRQSIRMVRQANNCGTNMQRSACNMQCSVLHPRCNAQPTNESAWGAASHARVCVRFAPAVESSRSAVGGHESFLLASDSKDVIESWIGRSCSQPRPHFTWRRRRRMRMARVRVCTFAFACTTAVRCWSADVRAHEHSFVRALGRLVKYHKPPLGLHSTVGHSVPRARACPSAQPLWVSGAIAARTG